jgi:hypothetical protein
VSRRAARRDPFDGSALPQSDAERWTELFGSDPPPRSRSLMAQAIAWREQMIAHGDVPARMQRDLAVAAADARARRSRSRQQEQDGGSFAPENIRPVTNSIVTDLTVSARADGAAGGPSPQEGSGATQVKNVSDVTMADPGGIVTDVRMGSFASLPPASSQLTPGTRLVKAYGGRNHVVEVTDAGMLYEGQLFRSLSAVAKAITGTHWNGLLFFGLRR